MKRTRVEHDFVNNFLYIFNFCYYFLKIGIAKLRYVYKSAENSILKNSLNFLKVLETMPKLGFWKDKDFSPMVNTHFSSISYFHYILGSPTPWGTDGDFSGSCYYSIYNCPRGYKCDVFTSICKKIERKIMTWQDIGIMDKWEDYYVFIYFRPKITRHTLVLIKLITCDF